MRTCRRTPRGARGRSAHAGEARAIDVAALRADGVAARIGTRPRPSAPSDAVRCRDHRPLARRRAARPAPVDPFVAGRAPGCSAATRSSRPASAILFIGLAFLAEFASEHVHVPVELRLAGIGAVALVLLVVGWRLRTRRAGYAQVLQGGAIAVLYLTLFVAFNFYAVLAVGAGVRADGRRRGARRRARGAAGRACAGGHRRARRFRDAAARLDRQRQPSSRCSPTTSCSTSASPRSRGTRPGAR